MPPRKRKAASSPSPEPSDAEALSDATPPPESQLESQSQSQCQSQSQSQTLEQSEEGQEESQPSAGSGKGAKRRKTTTTTKTTTKTTKAKSTTTKSTKASTSTNTTSAANTGGADTSNTTLALPPPTPNTLKIAAWNLCGWAACSKKGLLPYLAAERADVLVLTEHKLNSAPWPLFPDPALAARYPHAYWAFADKKGYSGTVILSTRKPLSVSTALPGHPDAAAVNGRIVTLEFPNTYLVGTYVVNAGEKLKTLDAKNAWNLHFTRYLRALDARKPVIWTGDLNVAPTALDLANAKRNWNKSAGYTEAETSAYRRILEGGALEDGGLPPVSLPPPGVAPASDSGAADNDIREGRGGEGEEKMGGEEGGEGEKEHASAGDERGDGKNGGGGGEEKEEKQAAVFKDVWRELHPTTQAYTYFSYRFNCRAKGIGWRLDMFVLSERIAARAKTCEIRGDVYGSDHVPLVLELEGEL